MTAGLGNARGSHCLNNVRAERAHFTSLQIQLYKKSKLNKTFKLTVRCALYLHSRAAIHSLLRAGRILAGQSENNFTISGIFFLFSEKESGLFNEMKVS